MTFLKTFLRKSLICCSLLSTAIPAHASLLDEISTHIQLKPVFPTEAFELVEEKDIFFKESPERLAKLDVQMSSKLITPQKYKDVHDIFEMDGFAKDLGSDDKVILAKMVAVLKNVRPSFFKASVLSTPEYLSKSISDAQCEVIDRQNHIVRQSKKLSLMELHADVYYSSYNFQTDEGQMMDRATAESIRDRFPIEENPVVIASVKAGPKDTNDSHHRATHGFRFINFYYDLNGKDTLLVAYKVITIKKEFMFMGPLWTKVQTDAMRGLLKGTKNSIGKLREYYLEQHSLNQEL